jgi:hypothetical protein
MKAGMCRRSVREELAGLDRRRWSRLGVGYEGGNV